MNLPVCRFSIWLHFYGVLLLRRGEGGIFSFYIQSLSKQLFGSSGNLHSRIWRKVLRDSAINGCAVRLLSTTQRARKISVLRENNLCDRARDRPIAILTVYKHCFCYSNVLSVAGKELFVLTANRSLGGTFMTIDDASLSITIVFK